MTYSHDTDRWRDLARQPGPSCDACGAAWMGAPCVLCGGRVVRLPRRLGEAQATVVDAVADVLAIAPHMVPLLGGMLDGAA